jgi:hypothetical protein
MSHAARRVGRLQMLEHPRAHTGYISSRKCTSNPCEHAGMRVGVPARQAVSLVGDDVSRPRLFNLLLLSSDHSSNPE